MFDTVKSGWFIVYIEGSHVIISKKILYFLLCRSILSKQTVQTLMKYRSMWHFILVFTVYQGTCLGVSGPQRINQHLKHLDEFTRLHRNGPSVVPFQRFLKISISCRIAIAIERKDLKIF